MIQHFRRYDDHAPPRAHYSRRRFRDAFRQWTEVMDGEVNGCCSFVFSEQRDDRERHRGVDQRRDRAAMNYTMVLLVIVADRQ